MNYLKNITSSLDILELRVNMKDISIDDQSIF